MEVLPLQQARYYGSYSYVCLERPCFSAYFQLRVQHDRGGVQIVVGVDYVWVIIGVTAVMSIFILLADSGFGMTLMRAEGKDLAVYQGGEDRKASDLGDYLPVRFRVFLIPTFQLKTPSGTRMKGGGGWPPDQFHGK